MNKNNIFENMEDIIPIEIPNTLLQKTRVLNKDIIGSKCNIQWEEKKRKEWIVFKKTLLRTLPITKQIIVLKINFMPLQTHS